MGIGYKEAGSGDIPVLAQMNHALIRDEGSENPMDISQLAARMEEFSSGEYTALLFLRDQDIIGYCLYRNEASDPESIYVRQYYILPAFRRQGLGKRAFEMLMEKVFTGAAQITLDVLDNNPAGRSFWESVGFVSYSHHLKLKRL